MNEGYYWIQYAGQVRIAYFVKTDVEDLDTGKMLPGYWVSLHGDRDIDHSPDIEVLSARLEQPSS
ncbi:hypothetical protein RHD99_14860 [Buttiauxella selenatireducens]|uniref:Uncharacterized protein n=1 Tax=Buttiauxella selenatireducens TaxID=3073902 RepID=A0ABY9S5G8_9ENTR|nr:hypothetical protein [Buttiauxella sp. R73]WMY72751.1 hypothetical protein RHD99_14860 [Buttiauxella sp. R73]GDX06658.1 hypothetical protein BSPA111_28700 [Buttiauxella sp. A111]